VARTQVKRVLSATAERVALAVGGSLSALLVLDDHDGV
jgi:hypothetical protein